MGVSLERGIGKNARVTRIAILGGGPGGYEAALVAAQLGGEVTVIDSDGIGGSAVLTDCVPSKTLIAAAEAMADLGEHGGMGISGLDSLTVDLGSANTRVRALAEAQSLDIAAGLERAGVRILRGRGSLTSPRSVRAESADGTVDIDADVILLATGARPRELPDAKPDGERILTWAQIYALTALPEHLIVVGSGVTGAEFASAYLALGSKVTLISSRDQVLPGQDSDAAAVIEEVFRRRGGVVRANSRAVAARRTADGVDVTLATGETVTGSHVLMAVGSIPNTTGIGLEDVGVAVDEGGYITVDRVSRTSVNGIYAAGDCTGVMMLASVAAMQGRIAMYHSLGDAVEPLRRETISSTIFTEPEIAAVGMTHAEAMESKERVLTLPLATNARAKMANITDGFVKIIASPGSGRVLGAVVCAPRASELIYPLTIAVANRLTVEHLANAFTVYPSLTGSIAEAARRLKV
jgi:dihydrolipoamide dehydrogenase